MPEYIATQNTFIGGTLYRPGEKFQSDAKKPGKSWKKVANKAEGEDTPPKGENKSPAGESGSKLANK